MLNPAIMKDDYVLESLLNFIILTKNCYWTHEENWCAEVEKSNIILLGCLRWNPRVRIRVTVIVFLEYC